MPNVLTISNLIEVLASACVTHMVESEFTNAGGIFLCAPPGQLKTTVLLAIAHQPGVVVLRDLTIKQFPAIREKIQGGRVHTLVFTDFPKLYERKAESASNVIGALRGLVDEGYANTGFESRVVSELPAYATVLGALTTSFLKNKIDSWTESGFARRFLFPTYSIGPKGHERVMKAIRDDKKIRLNGLAVLPLGRTIPMSITDKESEILERFAAMQYGDETPLVLLKKIMAVIRWRRKQTHDTDNSLDVILNFCQSLTSDGTRLDIDK